MSGDTQTKLLTAAKRYLFAAGELNRERDAQRRGMLRMPVLFLTAHGMEVLFKGNLLGAGLTYNELKCIGHDIEELWLHEGNRLLRDGARQIAQEKWRLARADPEWNFVPEFDDPNEWLEICIVDISALHGKETDYALRYVSPDNTQAPRPNLMIETFLELSDRCLKQTDRYVLP